MKKVVCQLLLSVLMIVLSLFIGEYAKSYAQGGSPYSKPYVVEDIDYDRETGIYTYTYIIKNLSGRQIWWWGIWYKSNPGAAYFLDDSTVDAQGFAPADLETCSPGWKNTALANRMGYYLYVGPKGESGFLSTYAGDFKSNNVPNLGYVKDGISYPLYTWEEVEAALDANKIQPSDLNKPWVGGEWGWTGYGANILTAYGIQSGDTGYYVVQSRDFLPGNKQFFYNTTDYWNSYLDGSKGMQVIGGFEATAITKRNYHKLGITISSPVSPVELRLEGENVSGQHVEELISITGAAGPAMMVDIYALDYGWYNLTASAEGYFDAWTWVTINEYFGDQDITLLIILPKIPPEFISTAPSSARIGELYTYAPQIYGPLPRECDVGYQVDGYIKEGYRLKDAPAGMSLSTEFVSGMDLGTPGRPGCTCQVSWIPGADQAGRHQVILEVCNEFGCRTHHWAITVIKLSPKTVKLACGASYDGFTVTGGASYSSYKWQSSDPQIASVDQDGRVSGKKCGLVTITVEDVVTGAMDSASVEFINIAIQPNEKTLGLNESFRFTASGGTAYEWFSANEAIATVDQQGVVTGKGVGTTTILVKDTPTGAEAQATVIVQSLRIDPVDSILVPGKSVTLSVAGGTPSYKWSLVSGSGVVTLDSAEVGNTLLVTAHQAGTSVIQVQDKDQIMATATVNVYALGVDQAVIRIGKNKQQQIHVSGGVPGTTYIWQSSNTRIATVNAEGLVSGVDEGQATITIKDSISGAQAAVQVTVFIVRLDPQVLLMKEWGEPVIITPSGGTAYTWESSNEAVAEVDSQGKVTAGGPGYAYITVTDSSDVSAQCSVTVVGISITPQDIAIRKGGDIVLSAALTPSDYKGNIIWQDGNSPIATVNNNSKVLGLAAGKIGIVASDTASGAEALAQVTVVELTVEPTTINKSINQVLQLTPHLLPEGYTPQYEWSSDHPEVASVDQNGSVTTLTAGQAIITVLDKRTNAFATSFVKVAEVKVTPNSAVLTINESITLSASGGTSYKWQSSKTTVVEVDSNGRVTAVGEGTANITATDRDSEASGSSVIRVVSVRVNPTQAYLAVGKTVDLAASGGTPPYTWSSENTAIATVQPKAGDTSIGTVTGKTGGTVAITARGSQGFSATATVQVVALTISPSSLKLAKEGTATLTVSGAPNVPGSELAWVSLDPSIAKVEGSGSSVTISGKKAGSTKIKVTEKVSGAWAEVSIDVVEVVVSPSQEYLGIGITRHLTASGGAEYTWSSSNAKIVSVDLNGYITGLQKGDVTVTAADKASGAKGTARVQVVEVIIDPAGKSMAKGDSITLKASGGCGSVYGWSSSNTSVATVDASGKVTAKASGQVSITAQDQCSGANAKALVKVVSVVINPASLSLPKGSFAQLRAEGGTSYVWSTSDSTIVSVDTTGKILAEAAGTARILARDSETGATGEATVKVVDITLTPDTAAIAPEEEILLTASGADSYEWDGCLEDIAACTVKDGSSFQIVGKAPGTLVITATDKESGAYGTAIIEVANINVTPQTARIGKHKSLDLTVTGGKPPYQ